MFSPTIIFLWLVAVPIVPINAEQEAIDAVAESSRVFIPAKPIERTSPTYPQFELRHRKQAWVRIAYCIDESGSPQNVSVLDSVGSTKFDKAAIETVKQWKFEPALVNGEPSWQSRNQTLISFAIKGGNIGATRRFGKQFRKIGKLLDQKNLEDADKLFWQVYETYDLSLYELSKLWALRVRHEGISGDMYMLDMALHRATASKGQWIEEKSYIRLLELRVRVELKIGQYHSAMRAFRELVKVTGKNAEEVLVLKPTMEKLRDTINGDQILKIDAEVRTKDECNVCNNSWAFTPVRNDFSFANIAGTLESIEMRCNHKRYESAVSGHVEWHIPDSWGTCHVQVYGEPGTTFDVLMLPSGS